MQAKCCFQVPRCKYPPAITCRLPYPPVPPGQRCLFLSPSTSMTIAGTIEQVCCQDPQKTGSLPWACATPLPSSSSFPLPSCLLFSLINSVDKPRYNHHAHNIITAFMELVQFVGLRPLPVLSFSPLEPSEASTSIYSILQRRKPRLGELSGFP